jgi:hypothetical protein
MGICALGHATAETAASFACREPKSSHPRMYVQADVANPSDGAHNQSARGLVALPPLLGDTK